MAKEEEIEIKLLFEPDCLARFRRSRLLRRLSIEPATQHRLYARYYDTEDFAVKARKITLRTRRENGAWVQTVKSKGGGGGALKKRQEYNLTLKDGTPRLDLIADRELSQELAETIAGRPLIEVCVTDVRRVHRLIRYRGSLIEIAIDSGRIVAGKASVPVSEIELELKEGSAKDLLDLVLDFREHCPFVIGSTSKASRGYNLRRTGEPYSVEPVYQKAINLKKRYSAWRALQEALGASIKQLLVNQAVLATCCDSRALVQVHGALRQIDSLFVNLKKVFSKNEERKALRRELKAVLSQAEAAKRWDDFVAHGLPSDPKLPEEEALLLLLLGRVQNVRKLAYGRLHGALESKAFVTLLLQLEHLLVLEEGGEQGDLPIKKLCRSILTDRRTTLLSAVPGDIGLLSQGQREALAGDLDKLCDAVAVFGSLDKSGGGVAYAEVCDSLRQSLQKFAWDSWVQDLPEVLAGERSDAVEKAVAILRNGYRDAEPVLLAELEAAWRRFVSTPPFWRECVVEAEAP